MQVIVEGTNIEALVAQLTRIADGLEEQNRRTRLAEEAARTYYDPYTGEKYFKISHFPFYKKAEEETT